MDRSGERLAGQAGKIPAQAGTWTGRPAHRKGKVSERYRDFRQQPSSKTGNSAAFVDLPVSGT